MITPEDEKPMSAGIIRKIPVGVPPAVSLDDAGRLNGFTKRRITVREVCYMGLFTYMIGSAIHDRKSRPRMAVSQKVNVRQNTVAVGGPGRYGTMLREEAVLQFTRDCYQNQIPVVCLTADAAIANELADSGAEVFGINCAYDPFAGCRNALEVTRVVENLLPAVSVYYGSNYHMQSIQLLSYLVDTIIESYSMDALAFSNFETMIANLETQHDALSFLQWAQMQGYRVSISLANTLNDFWQTGVPGLTTLFRILSRALYPLRGEGLPDRGVEAILADGGIAAAYCPPADRCDLASVIGTELINIRNAGYYFGLADYEVQLPESLLSLFSYNGQNALPFVITSLSVTAGGYGQQRRSISLREIAPFAEQLAVLGMSNMAEARAIAELIGGKRMEMMPVIGGGPRSGLGFQPMEISTVYPEHLVAGHGIPDGGGAVSSISDDILRFSARLDITSPSD